MILNKYCNDPQQGDGNNSGSPSDLNNLDSDKPRQRRRYRNFWIYIICLVVVFGLAAAAIIPLVVSRAPHTAIIRVPEGATSQTVADSVARYLGRDFADHLQRALPIATGGESLQRGAWRIDQGMTAIAAARRIGRGAQSGIRVTFVNERTVEEIAAKLAAKLDVDKDSMIAAFSDPNILSELRTDREHIIGLFLADTYEFYWTATPAEIIKKLQTHYDRFWTNERMDEAAKLHLHPREIVTIASIVDEETNQSSEKGMIGRLYINRLQKGMRLQADPTVKYAMGDFSIRRITGDMLNNPSPYNTYRYDGLPPGPIRITSGATIDAILTSRPHSYLYMCASEDFSGRHNFALDYDTHLRNARLYQQALDQRGIR